MRVAILADGMGTRLQEETVARPKPMVEIGGMPILWHIMKHYRSHGFRDFVVALGYMGDFIKNFFLGRYNLSGHLSIDFAAGRVQREEQAIEDWQVQLVDTGPHNAHRRPHQAFEGLARWRDLHGHVRRWSEQC